MVVDVEQLYKSFGVLADAKDKACEKVDSFKVILGGVTGNTAVKRLSAQFIARFFKHFPDEAENAISALVDLCEDDDVNIRKAAVKELPNLCKSDKQYVLRLTDVLVQMLASEDSSELSVVNTSLYSMFNLDAKATLTGVLSQILNGEEDVREKAINYLCKVLKNGGEQLTKEVEVYVLEECKKVMEDVTGDEFAVLMQGLSSLQHIQTIIGRQQLIDIIADQMELSKDFDVKNVDDFNRVNQCIGTALTLCSKNVHGSKFVNFICNKVLPTFTTVVEGTSNKPEEGDAKDSDKSSNLGNQQLELAKKLAELSTFCGNGETVADCVQILFEKLQEYMPLPPSLDENGQQSSTEDPKLQFSLVECLMYAFHQLGRNKQDFLTSTDSADRLKDFRLRLQYFARGTKVYINEIQASLAGKTPKELQNETENQIKLIALKTCNNVNTLIKDLFHNPPSYKSSVNLSWKKVPSKAKAASVNKKRSSDQGLGGVAAKKKDERTLYRTPGGKYSQNISFPRGRGRGRGGRGGRQQRNDGGYNRY